jgi:hypothetical protein
MSTTETRFNDAVAAVQAQGVPFVLNVMTCCRSCAGPTDVGLTHETEKTTPYAWTFGGQACELLWDDGRPVYRNEMPEDDDEEDDGYTRSPRRHNYTRPADTLYVNHGGPDLKAAQVVIEVFRGQGFRVDWDGTEFDSVLVHFA